MMAENKSKIALVAIVIIALVFISVSIGNTMGVNKTTSKYEEKIVKINKEEKDSFKEDVVTEFLLQYYTFETTGDNFNDYKDQLTPTMQKEQRNQLDIAKKSTGPQNFGHSSFVRSLNYIRKIDGGTVEVISMVTHTLNLLNTEGEIVKRGLENNPIVKLQFVKDKDSKEFLVNKLELITISE